MGDGGFSSLVRREVDKWFTCFYGFSLLVRNKWTNSLPVSKWLQSTCKNRSGQVVYLFLGETGEGDGE